MTYKYKFIALGTGDNSVGIGSSECIVTFNTDHVLDEDEINNIKDFLIELDDNNTTVYTEEEYNKMMKNEEEYWYDISENR